MPSYCEHFDNFSRVKLMVESDAIDGVSVSWYGKKRFGAIKLIRRRST